MSSNAHISDTHPDDGALLRHLDREEVAPAHLDHLARCSNCQDRLSTIRDRSAFLDDVLWEPSAEIGTPKYDSAFLERISQHGRPIERRVPPRVPMSLLPPASLRWAAGLALFALAMSFAPVRAWVVRVASVVWETVAAPGSISENTADGLGVREVVVPVTDPRLVVRLTEGRLPDRVVVSATAGPDVVARLEGPAGGELLVLPGSLAVDAASEGAQLFLELPPGTSELVLEVGDSVFGVWGSDAWEREPLVVPIPGGGGA